MWQHQSPHLRRRLLDFIILEAAENTTGSSGAESQVKLRVNESK
jgi:hypothetical protein